MVRLIILLFIFFVSPLATSAISPSRFPTSSACPPFLLVFSFRFPLPSLDSSSQYLHLAINLSRWPCIFTFSRAEHRRTSHDPTFCMSLTLRVALSPLTSRDCCSRTSLFLVPSIRSSFASWNCCSHLPSLGFTGLSLARFSFSHLTRFSRFSPVLFAYPLDLRCTYFRFIDAALATLHDDDTHHQKPSAPMEVR